MDLRQELIKICHEVYDRRFVFAYGGNLSPRIDLNRILITPSGKNKGELTEDDLLEIDYT